MTEHKIVVSLPEDLASKVETIAAERDTTVSALVADLLARLDDGAPSDGHRESAGDVLTAPDGSLRIGPITWTRDELHER
ncbi:hypothetical protein MLP_22360 [Microlunatus phosphovorus NM-1]|uniref:Uncharacterized protein n=1 Tax=Microlunatus phosphovorus (strain ATCC 700054 / DSM 10555 / JCM 9379 / NBRC 101784 / NCIMB 13414 / VKM Ac-1990 / NM-1) TaxID=1032480 RepID=F5XEN4_MICPN|nr:hypothetical protein [Microlunatus phosphovorus]BAK35250.1 hypothetical protein MLP_22360 [Microlunatus phosphovorus NM-1]